MSEQDEPDYKWRPATKGDIGSVARFSDEYDDEYTYGILTEIYDEQNNEYEFSYFSNVRGTGFDKCEIQYDANKEP